MGSAVDLATHALKKRVRNSFANLCRSKKANAARLFLNIWCSGRALNTFLECSFLVIVADQTQE